MVERRKPEREIEIRRAGRERQRKKNDRLKYDTKSSTSQFQEETTKQGLDIQGT